MQCQTVKLITIPACEPFAAFETVLPNTFLKLTVDYAGIEIKMEGNTYETGIYPVQLGLFPSGMVNQWDRFKLTFTDVNDNPVDADSEGNNVFILQPE